MKSVDKPKSVFQLRAIALVVDIGLIAFVYSVLSRLYADYRGMPELNLPLNLFLNLLPLVISIPRDIFNGRSLGKRVAGIAVRNKSDGQCPSVVIGILRNVPILIFPIDLLYLWIYGESLGDRLTKTNIVPFRKSDG